MHDFIDLYRSLMRINGNPCTLDIYDIFEYNDTVYVVESYFEGIKFKDFLRASGGELSWEQTKLLFIPLLSALSDVHEENIVHRGISPNTILINRNGEMKLTCFSIPSVRTAKSELYAELFDGYSAPEQYQLNAWQGTWTDVYGIAATIYRTLTGVKPPTAPNRQIDDTLIPAAALNRSVPDGVSIILDNALSTQTDVRTQVINELLIVFAKIDATMASKKASLRGKAKKSSEMNDIVTASEDEIRKKRRFRSIKYALISGCAALVVLSISMFLLDGVIFGDNSSESSESSSDSQTSSSTSSSSTVIGDTLVVPNFIEKSKLEIETNSEYDAFKIIFVEESSQHVPAGYILAQDIPADTEVDKNEVINLTVSSGPKIELMPDIVGTEIEEATPILDALGIQYQIYYLYDEDVEKDFIVRASKSFGDEVNTVTDRIDIFVSNYEGDESSDTSSSSS